MNITKVSKYISLILRHKPEEAGISLDKNGWAKIDELIKGVSRKYKDFNMDILEEIVATDEKHRYSFNEDHTLIRANQGHSVKVDVELEQRKPPEFLYHGTGEKYRDSIDNIGLIPKSRLHVHLSDNMLTAVEVGGRHGDPVVYRVHAKEMYKNGFAFYLSKNGVWLTERVPVWAIERVM